MERTATAIALATVLVAAGLSVAPAVTAGHNNCHGHDFDIASSEANAMNRTLDPGESIVGKAVVDAGSPEDLFIELLDEPRELEWTVYTENSLGNCVVYDSGKITDSTAKDEVRSTLDDPASGDEDYWVLYENVGTKSFEFKTWIEI